MRREWRGLDHGILKEKHVVTEVRHLQRPRDHDEASKSGL